MPRIVFLTFLCGITASGMDAHSEARLVVSDVLGVSKEEAAKYLAFELDDQLMADGGGLPKAYWTWLKGGTIYSLS